jgi:hypothetical protein
MYNWRLVTELDAFVYLTEKKILLVPAEKVSVKKRSLSISGLPNKEKPLDIALSNNEFEVRFSDALVPQVRNKELPGGKEVWYELVNYVYYNDYPYESYYRKEISKLLKFDGIFQGMGGFEAIFSDEYPGKVKLILDGMDEYESCFSEMTRRLNCSLYKKTKKWIPGHRYDTEDRTYYYLGSYYSNRDNLYESNYKSDVTEYHLVTEVKGDCKTISDVFKTRLFGSEPDNIIVLDALKPMVDSGEAFKDDVSDIQDLWDDMIELASKEEKTIKPMFDVVGFRGPDASSANKYKDTSSWEDTFLDRLKKDLRSTAIIYWNVGNVVKENNRMNASESDEFNTTALWDLFCEEYLKNDFNCRKMEYYMDLLDALGIPVNSICLSIINSMKSESFANKGFDNYLKYGKDYYRFRDNHGRQSFVYAKSGSKLYRSNDSDKISDRFPPLLAKTVNDIVKEAIINYGNGVSSYSVENYGTKSSPDIFHEITISMNDIISHFGGQDQLPDQIKQEIIDKRVWEISVLLGQDVKLG